MSFTGFTPAALEHFAPQLRQMGLDPRQGVSGGGTIPARLGDPRKLEPGSMISVQLISGDMTVGAEGTITAIDGDRIYAFGHRFLDEGSTDLPFASAEVLALLPNVSSSFKISAAREWMGSITSDRDTRRLRAHWPPGKLDPGPDPRRSKHLPHAPGAGPRHDAAADADGAIFGYRFHRA